MATKSVVQLTRDRAVKLLVFCGWHNADQSTNEKLEGMLAKLDKVYEPGKDPEPDDEEMKFDLHLVMNGINEGDDFSVVDGEESVGSENESKNQSTTESEQKSKGVKEKQNSGPSGVRVSRTISHICGEIFRKHGFEDGVTDEMAAEWLQETGKEDVDSAKANLAWAWHVINGYTKKFEVN